jgi:dipeptidyl aminopeptidase/acylaminoacyl peptidase
VDAAVEQDIHEPFHLPGDRGILLIQHRARKSPDTIQVFANGERRTILQLEGQNLANVAYSASGHVLFVRIPDNPGLWALPFSLETLEATGDPVLVAPRASEPSTAADGTLAHLPTLVGDEVHLAWYSPSGEPMSHATEPLRSVAAIALSPDDRRVAVSMRESATRDIYVIDLERGTRSRLTFRGNYNSQPSWSPDGRTLVYRDNDDRGAYIVPADGTEQPRLLAPEALLPAFTPDGKRVLFASPGMKDRSKTDLFMIDATGADTTRIPLVTGVGNDRYGAVSPDGRYLSFVSDETGSDALFLTTFPSATGKWQVSVGDDARWPRWAPDGRAIYFLSGEHLMMVTVEAGVTPRLGLPRQVLATSKAKLELWGTGKFDIARDGRVLLVETANRARGSNGVLLVQNWIGDFAGRASSPAPR